MKINYVHEYKKLHRLIQWHKQYFPLIKYNKSYKKQVRNLYHTYYIASQNIIKELNNEVRNTKTND